MKTLQMAGLELMRSLVNETVSRPSFTETIPIRPIDVEPGHTK